FRQAAREFPGFRCRIVRRGNIRQLVRQAACVLNCTSSAGIEAGLLGVPVIELIPAGSLDLVPASQWGTLGPARTEGELRRLLRIVLEGSLQNEDAVNDVAGSDSRWRAETPGGNRRLVFAAVGREA